MKKFIVVLMILLVPMTVHATNGEQAVLHILVNEDNPYAVYLARSIQGSAALYGITLHPDLEPADVYQDLYFNRNYDMVINTAKISEDIPDAIYFDNQSISSILSYGRQTSDLSNLVEKIRTDYSVDNWKTLQNAYMNNDLWDIPLVQDNALLYYRDTQIPDCNQYSLFDLINNSRKENVTLLIPKTRDNPFTAPVNEFSIMPLLYMPLKFHYYGITFPMGAETSAFAAHVDNTTYHYDIKPGLKWETGENITGKDYALTAQYLQLEKVQPYISQFDQNPSKYRYDFASRIRKVAFNDTWVDITMANSTGYDIFYLDSLFPLPDRFNGTLTDQNTIQYAALSGKYNPLTSVEFTAYLSQPDDSSGYHMTFSEHANYKEIVLNSTDTTSHIKQIVAILYDNDGLLNDKPIMSKSDIVLADSYVNDIGGYQVCQNPKHTLGMRLLFTKSIDVDMRRKIVSSIDYQDIKNEVSPLYTVRMSIVNTFFTQYYQQFLYNMTRISYTNWNITDSSGNTPIEKAQSNNGQWSIAGIYSTLFVLQVLRRKNKG